MQIYNYLFKIILWKRRRRGREDDIIGRRAGGWSRKFPTPSNSISRRFDVPTRMSPWRFLGVIHVLAAESRIGGMIYAEDKSPGARPQRFVRRTAIEFEEGDARISVIWWSIRIFCRRLPRSHMEERRPGTELLHRVGLFDRGRSSLYPRAPVTSSNLHLFRPTCKNYGAKRANSSSLKTVKILRTWDHL